VRPLILIAHLFLLASTLAAQGTNAPQPGAAPPAEPAAPSTTPLEEPPAQATLPIAQPTAALSGQALTDRLAALDPRTPWAYFELGEELSVQSGDPTARALSRTLFVLAYETAKTAPPNAPAADSRPSPAGADIRISVCLALASIAADDSEKRWLRAIASSLGWEGTQGPIASGAGRSIVADPAALELATALGLIRIGEGRRAVKLLEKPEVSQLLDHTERLLSPGGMSGGSARVRRLMAEWPTCTECKNRRFTKSAAGVRLCAKCGGKPGPKLPQQELLYQLRLESSLLHGVQRSWVAQTVVDGGAPLRDLDPDELAATYRVEPAATLWRGGRWSVPASASSAAASPPAPAAESGR